MKWMLLAIVLLAPFGIIHAEHDHHGNAPCQWCGQ